MLNRDYIEIMTSALSEKLGVKAKAGNQWRADIKNKTLEYNSKDIQNLDPDICKGLLIHELGHIKFTDEPDKIKSDFEKKYPEALHEITNAFEDLRITYKLNREYGNFSKIPLQNIDDYFTKVNIKEHSKDFLNLPKLSQFLHMTLNYDNSLNNRGVCDSLGYGARYILDESEYNPPISYNSEVIKKFLDNKQDISNFLDSIDAINSTNELKNQIISRIAPIVQEYINEFEKNPPQKEKQIAGKPSGKIGEAVKETKNGNIPSTIGQSLNLGQVIDKDRFLFDYGEVSRTLGRKIKDILIERKATHYLGNKKSGKLLSKNIFKIALDETNIFSKKADNLPDKYIFYLALDCSGSMGDNKKSYFASIAGYIFKTALHEANIPTDILQYDIEAMRMKDISEYKPRGGTEDVKAFELIYRDFKNYPDFDKIILVVTDGDTFTGGERSQLIDKIKKDNGKIIAIGIGTDIHEAVLKANYPDYIYLKNPSELPKQFLSLLNRIISR